MKLTNLILSNNQNTSVRILILCGVAWLPLLILTIIDGALFDAGVTIPLLKDVVPNVRGLIVIPLLVIADNVIEAMMARTLRYLRTSGIVPEPEQWRLNDLAEGMAAWINSKWVQLILVILAVGLSWWLQSDYTAMLKERGVTSWLLYLENGEINETMAGIWFLFVTSPLVSFLLYRWLWRFVAWSGFLYCLSRVKLDLYASHADLAGGLAVIGVGQCLFGIVFFILAAMISSEFAGNMLYQGETLVDVKRLVFVFICISIIVLLTPLLFFSKQLYQLKYEALIEYGALQYRGSRDFHKHWINEEAKDLMDSMQPSAIADYGAIYGAISNMRIVPISPKMLVILVAALLTPFLPLLLIKSSVWDVLKMLGGSLA